MGYTKIGKRIAAMGSSTWTCTATVTYHDVVEGVTSVGSIHSYLREAVKWAQGEARKKGRSAPRAVVTARNRAGIDEVLWENVSGGSPGGSQRGPLREDELAWLLANAARCPTCHHLQALHGVNPTHRSGPEDSCFDIWECLVCGGECAAAP